VATGPTCAFTRGLSWPRPPAARAGGEEDLASASGSLTAARYCASMSLAVAAENSSLKLRLIQSASSSAVRRRSSGRAPRSRPGSDPDIDQPGLRIQEADLAGVAFDQNFRRLAAQQGRHGPDVVTHIGHLVGSEADATPAGEAGSEAGENRPGARALSEARPFAATGTIRFDGISTPVPSRIRSVFTAAAPIATKMSALSTCVSAVAERCGMRLPQCPLSGSVQGRLLAKSWTEYPTRRVVRLITN